MAAFYQAFETTRPAEPDAAALLAQLKALDASAGVQHAPGTSTYVLKKATAWTAGQINAAQTVLDTAPTSTPETIAQAAIDALPIVEKAIVLTLIDELNNVREWIVSFKAGVASAVSLANLQAHVAALPDLPDRTVPQAIAAVRAKAGTL